MNKQRIFFLPRFLFLAGFFCILFSVTCTLSYGAVPHFINYQGRLTDSGGAPLNGSYQLTFRIYDASVAGNLLWEENYSGVVIQKGIFSVLLGSVTNLNLAFDKPYFLEIKVGNEVMSPRQSIASAGYAIRAETAEKSQSSVTSEVAGSLTDTSFLMPKGAIIMCKSACPSGYARVTELDGKFITGGATYSASAGGSNTHSHNIPAHSHSLDSGIVNGITPGDATGSYVGGNGGYMRLKGYVIPPQPGSALKTTTTLSAAATSGPADSRPEFATIIFCEKQ